MPQDNDAAARSWDAIADDWIAHADCNDYRLHYLVPRMLAMAGDVRGQDVLDLGCGEGGYARALAGLGARVTGVDACARFIEVARARTEPSSGAVFLQADAAAVDMFRDSSFDLVIAAMSLMDVDDYPGAIRHVRRVLRPGGELLMSILHPCFSTPASGWVRDRGRDLEHFGVDRYFDRVTWEDTIAPTFRAPVVRHHRPLEDFMAPPLAAGLSLREFIEPSVTSEELALSRRFKKLERIPYFLFMRWQKPSTSAR